MRTLRERERPDGRRRTGGARALQEIAARVGALRALPAELRRREAEALCGPMLFRKPLECAKQRCACHGRLLDG
jgi:hypothetical protein